MPIIADSGSGPKLAIHLDGLDAELPWIGALPEADRSAVAAVQIRADDDPEELVPLLPGLELIEIWFASFKDGRAFSQARLLRSRYGYAGKLRAAGDILPDQLGFMVRCGFDSFAPAQRAVWTPEQIDTSLREMTYFYQPDALGSRPVFALRHAADREDG